MFLSQYLLHVAEKRYYLKRRNEVETKKGVGKKNKLKGILWWQWKVWRVLYLVRKGVL